MRHGIRVMVLLGVMLIFGVLAANAQKKEEGVLIQATNPGLISVKPQSSLTLAFQVQNLSRQSCEFFSKLGLPEGWKPIMQEFPFKLEPGEQTIRLVGVFVPLKTLSGDYFLSYTVTAKESPSLTARFVVKVRVLLESRFVLQAMESPKIIIGGDKYQSSFLLINQSNASFTVNLEVESQEQYPFQIDVTKAQLKAGESVPLNVTVETDSKIRRKISHRLQVKAKVAELDKSITQASAFTQVDIVPKISGEKDYFHRIPLEFSLIALTNSAEQFTQFRFSGSGTLNTKGATRIDFLFRGPGRKELLNFGFQHEEYWLSLETPKGKLLIGDRVYSLSKLTEYGHYGRGIEGELTLRRFSLKTYYQESLFFSDEFKRKQKAFQVSYSAGEKNKFYFNYLGNKVDDQPEDQTYSFQSKFLYKVFNLSFEYALGKRKSKNIEKTDGALWLDASGRYKSLNYQLNIIRAGANYTGAYNNMEFRLGNISFSPLKNIILRGSYHDQKLNSQSELFLSSISEVYNLLGFQTIFFNAVHFSLDYRNLERQDLSPASSFHYLDRTVRVGVYSHLGPFDIQASVDVGKTYNKLSLQSCNLAEYMASLSYTPVHKLTFGGHFELRDQDKYFTGERQQGMDLRLDMSLNLSNTVLNAFFRTSLRREFYSQILEGHVLDDPLLVAQHLNLLEVSLTQRFSNGHSLAFRLRGASPLEFGPQTKNNFMGVIEYTIPVGFPVSRKTEFGELRGRVYNAEDQNKGLKGVIISANDLVTISNSRGEFVFHSLRPDKYYMSVDKKSIDPSQVSLQPTPLSLSVEGGRKTNVNIGLVRGSTISGRVIVFQFEGEDQEPQLSLSLNKKQPKLKESYKLRNTLVELKNEKESYLEATDEDGQFLFEELRPGQWTLKIYDNNLPELYVIEKDIYSFALLPGSREDVMVRVVPEMRRIKFIDRGEIPVSKEESQLQENLSQKLKIPEMLKKTDQASPSEYTFQLGSFLNEEKATYLKEELQKKYKNVYISKFKVDNLGYYRVLINFVNREAAQEAYLKLKEEGYNVYLLKRLFD